jgi:hypothetical protein
MYRKYIPVNSRILNANENSPVLGVQITYALVACTAYISP